MPPSRYRNQTNPISTSSTTLLQGRFKVSSDRLLGEGAFAKVYQGLDVAEVRGVAVKVYNSTDSKSFESFMKSVEVLTRLHRKPRGSMMDTDTTLSSPSPMAWGHSFEPTPSFKPNLLTKDLEKLTSVSSSQVSVEKVLSHMSFKDCFVELLGWSTDHLGNPGLDINTETYFLIFELGEASLSQVLETCQSKGQTLSVAELRSLHWALVTIVCGLHSEGFVHLDIKPLNIVRFAGVKGVNDGKPLWKLIDLDGALKTGLEVQLSDVVYTPIYMPPELALAMTTSRAPSKPAEADRTPRKSPPLTLSRLMDVWSVGICALEAIFLTPVLEPWYQEWREATGDDGKFLTWLGDASTDPIISGEMHDALAELDPDMCSMLEGMLSKDPHGRMCITECLNSDWLRPIRKEIMDEVDRLVSSSLKLSTGGGGSKRSSRRSWLSGMTPPREAALKEVDERRPDSPTVSQTKTTSTAQKGVLSGASTEAPTEMSGSMSPSATMQAKLVAVGVRARTCAVM